MKAHRASAFIYPILCCLIVLFAGCSSHQVDLPLLELNYSLSAFFDPQTINTLVVMPLENKSPVKNIETSIREELTLQLIGTDRYNVVDRYLLTELLQSQSATGYEVDSRLVKRIESQFSADAILLGKVTEYRVATPKWGILRTPPAIGLSLRMVSVKTGQTLWTLNHVFDGGDSLLRRTAEPASANRLSKDVVALTQVSCAEIAKTLIF